MPKYLVRITLSTDGAKGVVSEGGTARRRVVERMLDGLGGRLESMYWAFGDRDVYVTLDAPNNIAAAAMGLVSSATGGVKTSTVVLLTCEEMDEVVRQEVTYRAPGG